MTGCVFCAIIEGGAPAEIVHADDRAVAFLDVFPATPGHTLVVPRRHARDLWEIDPDEWVAVTATAQEVAVRLRERLNPDGLNILHATGAAAFQTVFHLHLHLVPRYRGDAVHLPWDRVRTSRETLAQVAGTIRGEGGSSPVAE